MATTTLTQNFTIPAFGQTGTAVVASTVGMVAGTGATITGTLTPAATNTSAPYAIISIIDATHVVLENVTGVFFGQSWVSGATVTFVAAVIPATFVCTPNALTTASACFSTQCLGPDDREAIQLMAMVFDLSSSGGTNYVNNLPQLLKDSASWMVLNEDQRRQINTYFTVINAIEGGAGLTLNMNLLRTNAACYLCLPWEQKKNVQIFLKCLLYSIGEPE